MEFLFDSIKNGGPSAVILAMGVLWVNGKLGLLDKALRERCGLLHSEVDRRILHMEARWDGVDRRNQETKS